LEVLECLDSIWIWHFLGVDLGEVDEGFGAVVVDEVDEGIDE